MMLNVTLASSLLILREGMKAIIAEHPDIVLAGEYSRATDLCSRTTYHKDEILVFAEPLYDLTTDVLRHLGVKFPPLKIILIAPASSMVQFMDSVKSGVRGLLTSDSAASCFPDAIRTVGAGRAYVSVEMLRLFTQESKMAASPKGHETLSSREREIFTRLAHGENNSVIGWELAISSKTVSTHKTRLMEKLGLNSVPDLVKYALQNGLIGSSEKMQGPVSEPPDHEPPRC